MPAAELTVGQQVKDLRIRAQRSGGDAHLLSISGTVDHVEPTLYGPRYRVRHQNGQYTTFDEQVIDGKQDNQDS